MNNWIRTFIAVRVEPGNVLLQVLREMKQKLAEESVRWVEAGNLHLTLKFLGNSSVDQVAKVTDELDSICRDFEAFICRLQGLGYFKSRGMPNVLFVKISNGEILKQLAGELNVRLSGIGFEPDPREFSPHLTLARIKYLRNTTAFCQTVEKYRDEYIQPVVVRELIFYQSILNSSGPVYKPLVVKSLADLPG